jgi:hypothetical protein
MNAVTFFGPTAAAVDMGQEQVVGRATLISAHQGGPTSGSSSILHLHFRGAVLREVRMSQREEQSFKIVAGVAGVALVGALVIAAVMALM